MGSAFLGAFQTAFIADGVHHDLALRGKEVGGQNEYDAHHDEEAGLHPPGAVLHLQAVECQSGDKQCSDKQHYSRITETVKGLEELHRDLIHSLSGHSYDVCSVAGQG